ncbi:MAG: pyruvate kinase [Candidatus Woesearchaeota archaeon]|jgi:pyruvate kinase
MQKTKILATIGPSSLHLPVLKKMCQAGLSGIRINTAHGHFDQYQTIIENIRKCTDLPIIIDVKGPELRVKGEPIQIKKNQELSFGKKHHILFNQDVYKDIKKGDLVLFDGAKITGTVTKASKTEVTIKFKDSGIIEPDKGVNIPGRHLSVPNLSIKDKKAIAFSKKHKVDFIALSFTRRASDVINLQKLLKNTKIGIIAKIENREGVDHIDEILPLVDGVMVARGDLGVELQPQKIPIVQKNIIKKANALGKLVIVATQVLESMVNNRIPTRAETSDIANAILDGADVIMLSEETAIGNYPSECIEVINKVSIEIEPFSKNNVPEEEGDNISEAITNSAYALASSTNIDKIVAITRSGYTATLLSRFRMKEPIIAITSEQTVARKLQLSYGVVPFFEKTMPNFETIIHKSSVLYNTKLVKPNDTVLIVAGIHPKKSQASNVLFVAKAKDLVFHAKN